MDLNVQLRTLREKHAEAAENLQAILDKAEAEDRNLNDSEKEQYAGLERDAGDYQERVDRLERKLKVGPHSAGINNDLGLSDKEKRRYSFLKVVRAMAMRNENPKLLDEIGFELECSRAIEKNIDRVADGIYIPREVWGPKEQRTLITSTPDLGGYFVEDELREDLYIGLLRNTAAVLRAGATQLPGLRGDISVPKQAGAGQWFWLSGEEADVTESNQTISQVRMSPKHGAAHTRYSKQTLLQSSIAIENFIRNDLSRIAGLGVDLAAFYGAGAGGQPRGLINTTNVNKPTAFVAATPTWAEITTMIGAIAGDSALAGWGGEEDPEGGRGNSMRWLTEGTLAADLMSATKDAGSGRFILEMIANAARIGLWELLVSNQITDGDLWFGNWADLLIGTWGDPDLIVNPFTNDTSGVVRLTLHQFCDVAVRHPEAFVYNNDD